MGEVVAAGWEGIRPGGIPVCRTCGTRFPRPAAADTTVLLELYKAKYNTKAELKEKGVPRKQPQSKQQVGGTGQQIGAPPKKDAPWTAKKIAELQKQVQPL